MIDTVVATADAVAGPQALPQADVLSVDEWNVWHQTANPHHVGARRAVQARAGAGRGRAHRRRRAGRRLPADHAAAPRRPGARSAAWRSSST